MVYSFVKCWRCCITLLALLLLSAIGVSQRRASASQTLVLAVPPVLIITAPPTDQSTTVYTPPPAGSNTNPFYEVDNMLMVSFAVPFSISVKALGDMESPTTTSKIPISAILLSLGLPNGNMSDKIVMSTDFQVVVPTYSAGVGMRFTTAYYLPVALLNATAASDYTTTLVYQFDQL